MSEIIKRAYTYEFKGLTFLEAGSHSYGTETKHFRNDNDCYYMEPLQKEYSIISKIAPNKAFNLALTDKTGMTEFYETSHGGNSSIKHSQEHIDELVNVRNSTINKIMVPCTTYPYFIRNILKKKINVFVLDIEGHETVVLNTMKELNESELPEIIVIECGYDWLDRKKILFELGYVLDFYFINNAVLTHKSFTGVKNTNVIQSINNKYKEFIWCGHVIFKNELI